MKKPFIPLSWSQSNIAQEKSTSITTLTSSPMDVVLSENIANFKFNPVEKSGFPVKAYGFLQVIGHIIPGETITISSNLTSITLTASTTPGASEFYTEAFPPTGPALIVYLETVAESIADTMNQSLSLFNNYSVTIINSQITVEANEFGENPSFNQFNSNSPNITTFNQRGTSKYTSQDVISYSAFCNIFVGEELYGSIVNKDASVFASTKIIDSGKKEANINANVVSNYVNHILPIKSLVPFDGYAGLDDGFMSNNNPIPNTDIYGNRKYICRPYFVEYGDKFRYVKNQAKKSFTKGISEVKWVQLGAFDKLMPYDMQDYVWNPIVPTTFKWLTSCPKGKTITNTSHEYMQVLVPRNSNANIAFLRLFVTFYDGTTFSIDKNAFSPQALAGNVSFDISPLAMNLSAIEATQGKLIDTYRVGLVWVVNGSVQGQSDYREFKYDRNCYKNPKNIIFVNEFGGWDSLEFRGEEKETIERSINTIERSLPYNANTLDAVSEEVKINISTDVNSTFVMNTGLLSYDMIEWSKKLDESSAVYIWDDEQQKYRNIIIIETNFINDSVETGQNLSVSYNYTTNNNSIRR
tara:strand:- start:537 stop:2282 length:1746 start_codon:yes stop_codon:yes gene_type:complete